MVDYIEFCRLFDQGGGGGGEVWVTSGAKIHGAGLRYYTSNVVEKNGDIFHF